MPLTAEEAIVGTKAYYPDDGIMVTVVDLSENGQVVVRANGADYADRPDFTVDPEELDAPDRMRDGSSALVRRPLRVPPSLAPVAGRSAPDTLREIARGFDQAAREIELTDGLRSFLGARLSGGRARKTTIMPDMVAGQPVLIVTQWDLEEHDEEPKRYLISEGGELQI